MNRRRFLLGLGGAVAGVALEQAIPLGRVWSFPAKVVIPETNVVLAEYADYVSMADLALINVMDPAIAQMQTDLSYRTVVMMDKIMLASGHAWGYTIPPDFDPARATISEYCDYEITDDDDDDDDYPDDDDEDDDDDSEL